MAVKNIIKAENVEFGKGMAKVINMKISTSMRREKEILQWHVFSPKPSLGMKINIRTC